MTNASLIIREDIYTNNIMELEEELYGLKTPLWPFICEDGKYSENKTNQFIQNIVEGLPDHDFLISLLYAAIRTMTTGYKMYYLLGSEKAFVLSSSVAVCPPGNERKVTVMDLIHHLKAADFEETAVSIYLALAGHPDQQVTKYAEELQNWEWPLNEEEEQEFEDYMEAWEEEHPEAMQERKAMSAPDAVDPEFSQTSYEDERSDEETDWEYHATYLDYLKQNERMKSSFAESEHFIRAVEAYVNYIMGHRDNKVSYLQPYQFSLIYRQIKKFMLNTSYTLFDQKEKMISVNANLIRAKMAASKNSGGRV